MRTHSAALPRLALALALGATLLQAQAPAAAHPQPEAQPATPVLKPHALAGADLDFTRGASLPDILARLGKAGGVTITLHTSAAAVDGTVSVDLRGLTFQQALDTLLLQNNLFHKVLSANAIMVFKKTPQNLQDFGVKTYRTFYLSQADVDTVRQNFNALYPQMRVFIDKRLHAVSVQATPGDLAEAQRVVSNLDKPQGEVLVQMEILEVGAKTAEAAALPALAGAAKPGHAAGIERAVEQLRKAADCRVLARPYLRVVSGEAGEIMVGQRQPADPAVKGTDPAPQDGFAGLKVRVRPRIHPDHSVTLALEYLVSTPAGEPGHARFDEQVLKTTVQVEEGETVAFGGLLTDATQGSAQPGESRKDRILVLKTQVVRRPDLP